MRTTVIMLLTLFYTSLCFGQAPPGINYQAVVRNVLGEPMPDRSISLRLGVKQDHITGTTVYQETHNAITDAHGLVNLVFGTGTVISGSFTAIDWGGEDHFFQVDLDTTGGNVFAHMGTWQLMSVPYALYANQAGSVVAGGSAVPTVQVFTSNGTWTKPAGLSYVVVEVVGGGGGGGAANSPTTLTFGGGGGGGGGYAREIIAAADLGTTVVVTVGAGGAGGIANDEQPGGSSGGGGDGDAADGSASAFGSHCSATGGAGGFGGGSPSTSEGSGGAGGIGSNAQVNAAGGGGGAGAAQGSGSQNRQGGTGGSSVLGGGAQGLTRQSNDWAPGVMGAPYGGGGGGGYHGPTGQAVNGGSGAPGVVILTEYY